MGKWNKAPAEVSQQFLQNQQRRKQMILEAARRRRQKQRKMQQQAQIQKKTEVEALTKHKQQKKDAYIKYLRNNMHDKYQEIKQSQKANQPQIRSKSKWKKDTLQSNSDIKVNEQNLQGLNLQVNVNRSRKALQNRIYNPNKKEQQRHEQKGNVPSGWHKPSNPIKVSESRDKLNKKKDDQQDQHFNEKRRMLQNQFEKLWNDDHQEQVQGLDQLQSVYDQMIGSKLLDSLDLDFQTVNRGKKLDKKVKESFQDQQQTKQLNDIKDMIGYESVLMSIDQRSEISKKYCELMTNEIPPPKIEPQQIKMTKLNNQDKNSKKNMEKVKATKSINQGQFFNQLKNKKQGKILNWANQQAEQADDLFSNCSTNKKSNRRGHDLLKQINKQIQQKGKCVPLTTMAVNGSTNINMKKKQVVLQTIPQKKINMSKQKLRERSYEKKNVALNNESQPQLINRSRQHNQRATSQQKITSGRTNRLVSAQNPPLPQRKAPRDISKERINKTVTNNFKQNQQQQSKVVYRNRTNSQINNNRSLSKQKQNNKSKQMPITSGYSQNVGNSNNNRVLSKQHNNKPIIPKSSQDIKSKTSISLNHLPPVPKTSNQWNDSITIATQDQVFQIQSFIKNQLLTLNKQQRKLQQQLRDIHLSNKDKLKEMEQKHQIRTDYKHSKELQQDYQQNDQQSNNSYKRAHKKPTQDELQQSIQRLDDMLLRKQIFQKDKNSRIIQQDNQSQSTSRSLINPMTDPITLHKQVLQLASNLSRFQGQPKDIDSGYGAKIRMMKQNKQKNVQNKKKNVQNKQKGVQRKETVKHLDYDLSQSQDLNYSQLNSVAKQSKVSKTSKMSKPPQLEYGQNNDWAPVNHNISDLLDDQLQDSIQKGKIQVNQRLKRMLLE